MSNGIGPDGKPFYPMTPIWDPFLEKWPRGILMKARRDHKCTFFMCNEKIKKGDLYFSAYGEVGIKRICFSCAEFGEKTNDMEIIRQIADAKKRGVRPEINI